MSREFCLNGIFVNEGNFVNEGEICAGCRCVCWRAGIPPAPPPLNTAANALCTYTCPNAPKVPITWSMHDTLLFTYIEGSRELYGKSKSTILQNIPNESERSFCKALFPKFPNIKAEQ